MFASEVIKRFSGDCEVSFVKLGSYEGTQTTGNVKTLLGLNQSLRNRQVILLEDIVDTGNTLEEINKILLKEEVANYEVATLFYKPEAYKNNSILNIEELRFLINLLWVMVWIMMVWDVT